MTENISAPLKRDWLFIVIVIVSLFISMIPRLSFMDRLSSNWRSSQTLLTSFWFQKEGISLFHSQLPLYGPPWEVPFEFPIYQAICAIFSNITHINLTTSSRIVSVGFFYISAILLLLLCLELLNNKTLSSIIFLVYLFLPYNILYSTEILIDYLSVALALGFILCINRVLKNTLHVIASDRRERSNLIFPIKNRGLLRRFAPRNDIFRLFQHTVNKYLDSPYNILLFIFSIIFGCLGAAVKNTTMAITIIPAILITLSGINTWGFKWKDLTTPKETIAKVGKQKLPFLLLTAIAVLPVLSAELWTKYVDGIKQTNIFTSWLASENLTGWTFGTWGMKTNFANWWNWFSNINNYFFLGGILLIFFFLAIAFLYRMPLKSRCIFVAALAGALLTIFIFFNLYLHEYYYIAISAYMSVLIGFGFYCLINFLLPHKLLWIVICGIFSLFILMKGLDQYTGFQTQVQAEINYENTIVIPLANRIAAITPENKYVISFQSDWWPDFILYTQRKGLILSPREYDKFSCDLVNKYDYYTIVVVDSDQDIPILLVILNCFRTVELIEPGIYRVIP